ncbi:hypothetical protein RRF57_006874 [Xylaria bambusicola]|uniref:AB hydrolase-1 domain-containing protein n=1 Tax=Xylaria bambusicola TaxID=326684 RepID=A0AAN7UZW2_9PEZI
MSSTGLPTPIIVIVPGAFCKPHIFDPLLPYLKAAGFTIHLAPIPSCDPADPTVATCGADSTSLRNEVLIPLLAKGEDIIVLAHSYGGTVAGGAVRNLDKDTRTKEGKAAGIIGLIYLAGIISLEGETVLQAVGGSLPPLIKTDKVKSPIQPLLDRGLTNVCMLDIQPAKGLSVIEPVMETLYNDYDPALEPQLAGNMNLHALLAFNTPALAPG